MDHALGPDALAAAAVEAGHTVLALGTLLAGAFVTGQVAPRLHLPRITGYLLAGMLLGPALRPSWPALPASVVPPVAESHLVYLIPLNQLAMALVLLGIGCRFPLARIRRILPRVIRVSAGEMTATFLLVAGGLWLLPSPLPASGALLLGILAIPTAPATTVMVMREYRSEGPVTEYATALVAINNLAAIVVFEVVLLLVHHGQGGGQAHWSLELGWLVRDLAGSALLGLLAGLLASLVCSVLDRSRWLLWLLTVIILLLGTCDVLQIPYLLAFLTMGLAIANSTDLASEIVASLSEVTALLCVAFFAVNGAELNPLALREAGVIGGAYVLLRLAGKYLGVFFTADPQQDGWAVRQWLGAALTAQAGAAIALVAIAAHPHRGIGPIGQQLQTVILGTVVVFEVIGPVLIRLALIRAGEVPLAHAISHRTATLRDALAMLANRLLQAAGRHPATYASPESLRVRDLMRQNVPAIRADASFDDVVYQLEHSPSNVFPVVADDGGVVGVIRYDNLRQIPFDPALGRLVCAVDLAVPLESYVDPETPAEVAWERLQQCGDDALIVVQADPPHRLLGTVLRRDLLRWFLVSHRGDRTGPEKPD